LLSKNIKIKVCRTVIVIVPVILYGCETLLSHGGEEHRLRVFEIRVLRMIFGPKNEKLTGAWKRPI